jgi:putative oxidoreductase
MDLTWYMAEAFWFLQAVVGVVFLVHGYGKVKSPAGVASAYGMPSYVGLTHGLVEVVGGVLLIADWYAQYVGLIFAVIMLGAIYFKMFKWKVPFMATNNTGWEFDLVLLAASLLVATAK